MSKPSNDPWDVLVIGAGAAGLLAACRAAERGRRTLLLEKNRKAGVKILMSGGTRCNITHDTDAAGIVEAFGRPGKFLRSALAALGPRDVVALIEAEGVSTKVEASGKIFPASDRAVDVRDAFHRRLSRSSCQTRLGESVENLVQRDGQFHAFTSNGRLTAPRVIVTTGGCSYPGCGTTGDGYDWLAALGHTIVTPRPALVPMTSSATWVRLLQGVTIADTLVRVVPRTVHQPVDDPAARLAATRRHCLGERRSALLLTHWGISGPAAMDVSRYVTAHADPRSLDLVCDLLPDLTFEGVDDELRQRCARHGGRTVARSLMFGLPERLTDALLQQCSLPDGLRMSELGKAGRRRLAGCLKGMTVPLTGTLGFRKAEVTAGGVALDQIDSRTMESKLVPGLFLAGEILDLDGPIGGYNFQAAFSTGWLAGQSV